MTRVLDVYLHETYTGQLTQTPSGKLTFAYNKTYVTKEQPALSLSLPLRNELYEDDATKTFFSGLLPDDVLRHRLARYLGVSEKNPFALLKIIGGECAGAISLYPQDVTPPSPASQDIEVLDNYKLKEILALLKRRPLLAGDDGLRLSLAGAQDKIAVNLIAGNIALVRGTSPTTHILKPMISDIKDSVHNELFCMQLAKLVGIDVPDTQLFRVDETPYFLVERYDRTQNANTQTSRLHQEDFCQALGIQPDMKYEREGGPNLSQCQTLLQQHSFEPASDQIKLLNRVIFNYLIGNNDAHGKNFSLLYTNKKPKLAPAYDLLSTAVYPNLSTKMAMKIGGRYNPKDVLLRHWHRLVPDTAIAKRNLEKQLNHLSKECAEKSHSVKASLNKMGIHSDVFDDIDTLIQQRTISKEP